MSQSRPNNGYPENMKPITVYVDVDMKRRLKVVADANGKNVQQYVRAIIDSVMGKKAE